MGLFAHKQRFAGESALLKLVFGMYVQGSGGTRSLRWEANRETPKEEMLGAAGLVECGEVLEATFGGKSAGVSPCSANRTCVI